MAESVVTDVSVSCTSEYPDYSYNAKHEIWTLVTLQVPCQEEDESDKRAAMDIVAVMDKSGSMAGDKLKLVKRTLKFILTQLGEKDRLSLITYDRYVYIDFALMNMTKGNKDTALTKIKNIRDGSATNLCAGLMSGLCQIIDRKSDKKNDVASVLLFTDGLANEGIQSISGIVAAMKDPKNAGGRKEKFVPNQLRNTPQVPAPHTSWLKRIFSGRSARQVPNQVAIPQASRSSEDEEEEHVEEMDIDGISKTADATVYTFGFGQDHNADMLKQISDAGNGMYYFIETNDKIGESFAHCLGGLMSTVAQGIQLQVTMEPGVYIKEVHTTRACEKNADQSAKVNIGDLQSEESRDIVIELVIDAVSAPCETTPQLLFNVSIDYFNVISNNLENVSGSLTVLRPEKEVVHDERNASGRLTKEKCRVSMTRAMREADEKASAGDYDGTRMLLQDQVQCMQSYRDMLQEDVDGCPGNSELMEEYTAMMGDLEEYQQGAADEAAWQKRGKNMHSNMLQQYECQRSAMPDAKAFRSKAKSKAVLSSKAFFK